MTEPVDLAAIEARAAAATEGPWAVLLGNEIATGVENHGPHEASFEHKVCRLDELDYDEDYAEPRDSGSLEADAEFIAHAREDVPALVAVVRRLRALLVEATPSAMGGTPDLFAPACSLHGRGCDDPWQCWEDRVGAALLGGTR